MSAADDHWDGDPPCRPDQTPIAPGRLPAPTLTPEWQQNAYLAAWVRQISDQGYAYTTDRHQRVVPAEQDEPDGAP